MKNAARSIKMFRAVFAEPKKTVFEIAHMEKHKIFLRFERFYVNLTCFVTAK